MRRILVAAALVLAFASRAGAAEGQPRILAWEGADRSYILYAPQDTASQPLPLVLVFHGAGGNANDFAAETHLAEAGLAHGMMVVFGNGTERTAGRRVWNAHFCCGGAGVDDVGFVGAIIDDVANVHPVDRKRVFATGMSNGGMFAYQLAAAHPEWFAAIAPVSATIGGMTRDGHTYLIGVPKEPVSVDIIHGRLDGYVMFDGGSSPNLKFPYRWKMSVADSMSFWAAADICPNSGVRDEVVPGVLFRTSIRDCGQGSEIAMWEIVQGDHSWPDDIFPGPAGKRSAAEEIVTFFAAHGRE